MTQTAAGYVRRALAAGAILASARSQFTRAAIQVLESRMLLSQLRQCEHADPAATDVVLVRVAGRHAFELRCQTCFTQPERSDGCDLCQTDLPAGLRVIVTPALPGHPIVTVGQLCRRCRRGRLS